MKIYLFRDHTGLIVQDGQSAVSVEGYRKVQEGSLIIGDKCVRIECGKEAVLPPVERGMTQARLMLMGGTVYSLGKLRTDAKGRIETAFDPVGMALKARLREDELEDEVEKLRVEVRRLKAGHSYDDLGIMAPSDNIIF